MRQHASDLRGVRLLPGRGRWTWHERPAEARRLLVDRLKALPA